MPFPVRVGALAVAATLLLVACGGSSGVAPSAGSASTATASQSISTPSVTAAAVASPPVGGGVALTGPSCNLISAAAAAAALGVTSVTASQLSAGTLSVCIYKGNNRELDLTLDTSTNASTAFSQAQGASGATTVSGIGDQAVWFAQPSGNVVVAALKGGTRVALGFGPTTGSAIGDAATQAARLQAVLAAIVGP